MPIIYDGRSAAADPLLAKMFLERKRVFIDLLGWDLPARDDLFELDQFDLPSTRYIVCVNEAGDHLGSLRLIPCNKPYLLGDIFPSLCAFAPPSSPKVWEISRLCLSRSIRSRERAEVRNRIATALVLLALEEDTKGYCCVADEAWGAQIQTFGWRCESLGAAQHLAGGTISALQIWIDQNTPDLLRDTGIWCEGLKTTRRKAELEDSL